MLKYLRRTRAIAHKELTQMVRDARVVYLALGLPVVMLVLFGFGVSMDIDHLPLAVVDQDRTPASRRLVESLVAGETFVRHSALHSVEEAEPLLKSGEVTAVIVVPEGFQRDRARGTPSNAQILVDGADNQVAAIAMGNAMRIVRSSPLTLGNAALPSPGVGPRVLTRFNPAMRSAYNIVPGVIVVILGMVSTMLAALAVAREWERGNMEQLFATPVRRSQIILGKLLPYAGLGFVQTLLVLTCGAYLFGVPIAGSLTLLFFAAMLFLVASLGTGLFISVATKSQLLSIQFSLVIGMLPALLLSGFMFPIANMPLVLQGITLVFPARYFLTALRGILLKGNGVSVLSFELLALTGFALVVISLAVIKFRRRLD